jgi:hypothetical protein
MLPKHLIAEYWHDVKQELMESHHLSEADATTAVAHYRAGLEQIPVGEVIYNRDPDKRAKTIAAGWRSGYLATVPRPRG